MIKRVFYVLGCSLVLMSWPMSLRALKAKSFDSAEDAQQYVQSHFLKGVELYHKKAWRLASDELERVTYFFPTTPLGSEANFYLGVCYFEMREFDFANEAFSNYLQSSARPEWLKEVLNYKFSIAEQLREGGRRRPFKLRYLPKWFSGKDLSLTIYDEIILAAPTDPLAIRSLFAKAELLKSFQEYRASIEVYQTLIRRFPRDELTPLSYLRIAEAYRLQNQMDSLNPDLIPLAELNVKKFKEEFPRDERILMAEELVQQIKEHDAEQLCTIGRLYERKGNRAAAMIYYSSAIHQFPDTRVAAYFQSKIDEMKAKREIPLDCASDLEREEVESPPLPVISWQEAEIEVINHNLELEKETPVEPTEPIEHVSVMSRHDPEPETPQFYTSQEREKETLLELREPIESASLENFYAAEQDREIEEINQNSEPETPEFYAYLESKPEMQTWALLDDSGPFEDPTYYHEPQYEPTPLYLGPQTEDTPSYEEPAQEETPSYDQPMEGPNAYFERSEPPEPVYYHEPGLLSFQEQEPEEEIWYACEDNPPPPQDEIDIPIVSVLPFASEEEAGIYISTHYEMARHYYHKGLWRPAIEEFNTLVSLVATNPLLADLKYHLGVCYFELQEHSLAREQFLGYLALPYPLEWLDQTLHYQWAIARETESAVDRYLFDMGDGCLLGGKEAALMMYQEIIEAAGAEAIGKRSLYAKGELLRSLERYEEALECYTLLIRRFRGEEMAALAYVRVMEIYCHLFTLTPDEDALFIKGERYATHFRAEFGEDPRVALVSEYMQRMREQKALTLCKNGQFYERLHDHATAANYYWLALNSFADTQAVPYCMERLLALGMLEEFNSYQGEPIEWRVRPVEVASKTAVADPFQDAETIVEWERKPLPEDVATIGFVHYSLLKKQPQKKRYLP